ncbi:hypothetical protein MMC20_002853 [Loxospora ochrophaea]|nr:hypothetical protein [Loxospora ochrophaea]
MGFLQLPLEVRLIIYKLVFLLQPLSVSDIAEKGEKPAVNFNGTTIDTSLLLTCRAVYNEARLLPFRTNVNHFEFYKSPDNPTNFTELQTFLSILSPDQLSALKILTIHCDLEPTAPSAGLRLLGEFSSLSLDKLLFVVHEWRTLRRKENEDPWMNETVEASIGDLMVTFLKKYNEATRCKELVIKNSGRTCVVTWASEADGGNDKAKLRFRKITSDASRPPPRASMRDA